MLHENNVLGMFLYAWGYRDAQAGHPMARLLATPQSFLDHVIGDLVGRAPEGRWFLFEFKRDRPGFAKEVKQKPARKQLMRALVTDPLAAELSSHAHFACWAEDEIAIQQYVVATDDPYFKKGLPQNTVFSTRTRSFNVAYENLTDARQERSPYRPQELFWHGTGVTSDGMYQYLESLLDAHPKVVAASEEVDALLGFWTPANAQVKLVPANFGGLLGAFDHARRIAQRSVHSGGAPD